MQETKDRILDFIKQNGPVLPVQISREIKSDILFASAILADLVKQKQIFLSYAKVGGSPLYYLLGQEPKLQVLKDHLHGREKDAFELIKKDLVIRDKVAEPWQRVALRSIKDFAIPLRGKIGEEVELFWKWYLTSNEEAKHLILDMFKKKEVVENAIKEPIEKQGTLKEIAKQPVKEFLKRGGKKEKIKKIVKSDFKDKVYAYFSEKKIDVIKEELIKNRNMDMIVNLPSEVGKLRFFVKAIDKKRVSDADLSLAYNEGQTRKLPVLLLTNGNLTKKARDYLEKSLEGYLIFRRV